MKIVYFNYLFDSQQDSVGASVHVNEFVQAMRTCGHVIRSFNLNPASISSNGKIARSKPLILFLKKRLKRYLGQLSQLVHNVPLFFHEWKILCSEQPDALIIRYNMLNFTAPVIAKIKRIPVILEVNSPHAFERKNLVRDIWQIPVIPFFIEWLNMRLAKRIYTVSEALRNYYRRNIHSTDKLVIIPNGVDIEKFSPGISSAKIRDKYNLNDKVVLGFVGSFHYWHGIDNILKLILHTFKKYSSIAFLLVGDGPLKEETEATVKSMNLEKSVIFTGYVPHNDIPFYVAAMDIALALYPPMKFFYFSPLKLFEYLSVGKAIIASRIGQISTLIQNGQNGILVDPENINDLYDKASLLIQDKEMRQRLGENGRQTILRDFTWQKNAEKVLEVVNQSLDSNNHIQEKMTVEH